MESTKRTKSFLEFIKEPLGVVLAALLLTQFLWMHTVVPTGSMETTMRIKERFIVSRIPYYYRDPQRQEIVIFKKDNQMLVKRVIGLPGDVVDIQAGKVLINGEVLEESAYIAEGNTTEIPHETFTEYPFIVPEDTYFLLGDNRQGSLDGRIFGPVNRNQIIATNPFRIYPFNRIRGVK